MFPQVPCMFQILDTQFIIYMYDWLIRANKTIEGEVKELCNKFTTCTVRVYVTTDYMAYMICMGDRTSLCWRGISVFYLHEQLQGLTKVDAGYSNTINGLLLPALIYSISHGGLVSS